VPEADIRPSQAIGVIGAMTWRIENYDAYGVISVRALGRWECIGRVVY